MARQAMEFVAGCSILGLGTGRAAQAFTRVLAEEVRNGLQVRCVPTSRATEALARELGVTLVSLDEVDELDLAVDGADEISPALDLIKGYGGAMVRERIVATAAKRRVILAEPEKFVAQLGQRGRLPVEVVTFGWAFCARKLSALGCNPRRRLEGNTPFLSDNGNYILDCAIEPLMDPAGLHQSIVAIPGVVDTGLFLGMADVVFLEDELGVVTVRRRPQESKE